MVKMAYDMVYINIILLILFLLIFLILCITIMVKITRPTTISKNEIIVFWRDSHTCK